MLTEQETRELIRLLAEADPRPDVAGRYEVVVTPLIFTPDAQFPHRKVCIVLNEVGNHMRHVVGECESR